MAGIGFTSDEEVSTFELGESLQEFSHKGVEISGDLVLTLVKLGTSRETGSEGLIEIEEVSVVVPSVGVALKGVVVLVDLERTVFNEKSKFTRTSGSTSQPDNEGISRGFSSGLEEPVEEGSSSI